ncbi:MAG: hypothetical protein KDK99_14580 [Verrucomicrobiales bacterium]|nr:hypothetical protein [Verrucomicrobiales bacterium]
MPSKFFQRPTADQLQGTVFRCLLGLSLGLSLASLTIGRFSPLRAIFDFHLGGSAATRSAVGLMGMTTLMGFGLIWLASPRLAHRYRWWCMAAFILGFFAAAMPE